MINIKQINWVVAALVRVSSFAASGTSNNVSTAIASALSTAGRGGVTVPTQVSANGDAIGIITSGVNNLVQIARADGEKIADASGNEVYGRLTETGGVYTLSYVASVNGVETGVSLAATTINFDFAYRFDFARLPGDFAIAVPTKVVNNDPRAGGTAAGIFTELLSVTALNTLSALTKTPNVTANLFLIVNTATYSTLGGSSAPFAVSGKAVTWSPVNAKFNLETGDRVIATYTTIE
jgi:spore maturation protein SpmB